MYRNIRTRITKQPKEQKWERMTFGVGLNLHTYEHSTSQVNCDLVGLAYGRDCTGEVVLLAICEI